MKKRTPEEILELAIKAADERSGKDIIALNMKGISILSDYQLIITANTNRQTNAIAQAIIQEAAKAGVHAVMEGKADGNWLLVDLGDVIVHIFDEENRHAYNLEGLWAEAPLVEISQWIIN
ncbi:ribosome silencing factor [Allofustis seminis]|uniref:ribosome silencing factor n=1 Tax=Allofustis seminis TaxID=166939 RepID=UPI0003757661|nr:ribosome silencing factor [Allofustis seminis]